MEVRAQHDSVPVHPRVCGEQFSDDQFEDPEFGSSPRVRGTDFVCRDHSPDRRFIPACAGNRYAFIRKPCAWTVHPRVCGEQGPVREDVIANPVHPRVCGEQIALLAQDHLVVGSSPRVRGTEFPFFYFATMERFIPACAGNRWMRPAKRQLPTVHPRVCGEQNSSRS